MNWFYARGSQQYGPLTSAQLAELSRSGALGATDLAWREGMAEWLPFHRLAGEAYSEAAGGDAGQPVETAVCAHTGRVLPTAELIPYGEQWIDPAHKEAFVQRLMEGGAPATPVELEAPVYVGFWWRVLGHIVDNLVISFPGAIVMMVVIAVIGVSAFALSGGGETNSDDPGMVVGGIILGYLAAIGAMLAVTAAYHTWMVARYQGTVGKLAIGAKIVTADGGRVSAGRAFCRWLCTGIMNPVIIQIGYFGGFMAAMGIGKVTGLIREGTNSEPSGLFLLILFPLILVGVLLGMFPYWMAGRDPEKRALHDRICSTRVVKK